MVASLCLPQDVYAGVKPAGKAAAVARLQERGKRVAMVSPTGFLSPLCLQVHRLQ